MKLVEAEAEGPIEGEDAVVTAPRPPHRRVSVSVLFTLTVLVGTVVAIYLTFPARNNVLMTEAIRLHREPPAWDLAAPSAAEVRAWALGVVGKDAPLAALDSATKIIGARSIEIFERRAAVVRFALGNDEVTYLLQHARGIGPKKSDRIDGDLQAFARRKGAITTVAVGPAAASSSWLPVIK